MLVRYKNEDLCVILSKGDSGVHVLWGVNEAGGGDGGGVMRWRSITQ